MSAFTGNYHQLKHDSQNRWILLGITLSLSLHLALAIAYFWTPSHNYQPPPPAAPIAVSLVAPLAAPNKPVQDQPDTFEQVETVQRVKAASEPTKPQPIDTTPVPAPKLMVKELDKPSEIQTVAKVTPNKIEPESLPKPSVQEKQEDTLKSTPKEASKPKEKTETQIAKNNLEPVKAEPEPEKLPDTINSVAKQASTTASVKATQENTQASALRKGQLSEVGKAARINWQQILHAHLEREKRYPRKARRMRKQGMPVISFTMNRDGTVLGVRLVKSSGTPSLDNEAIALAYRAQPLPKPPKLVPDQELTLTLPINFTM
ncbi:TonB family protein [Vibrio sp. T187]|nr:TonB family protein [Vibrio sp. T187]